MNIPQDALESRTYIYKRQPTLAGEPILLTVYYSLSYRGPNAPSRPIAMAFHGGGFMVGNKDNIPQAQIDYLARDHGFVVVSIDYRLCPQVTLAEGPIADSLDAYRWVQLKLPQLFKDDVGIEINPTRLGVLGYSAGGLLALTMAFVESPPKAIVDFYGSMYFSDPWWTTPNPSIQAELPSDFNLEFLASQVFSESPIPSNVPIISDTDPEFKWTPRDAYLHTVLRDGVSRVKLVPDRNFDVVDPAAKWNEGQADGKQTSFCFVHGDRDELIPYEFSERAVKELSGRGIAATMIRVPGAMHGFDIWAGRDDSNWVYIEEAMKFLAEKV